MPQKLIYEILDAYGAAADVAKRAGFGMVMVHASATAGSLTSSSHRWKTTGRMSSAAAWRTGRGSS